MLQDLKKRVRSEVEALGTRLGARQRRWQVDAPVCGAVMTVDVAPGGSVPPAWLVLLDVALKWHGLGRRRR